MDATIEHWRGRIALLTAMVYAAFYLYAIGDIDIMSSSAWSLRTGRLEHLFSTRSLFLFEAVMLVEVSRFVVLVSPMNLAIAAVLAGLLGANIHGALSLRFAPTACRAGGGKGTVAGALPALLAGSACCAPSLILLLGLPGLGALSAFFGYLIPLSAVALLLNRWWQRRRGAPPLM